MSEVEARFWLHVDASGDCWLWTGALGRGGYGSFKAGPKTVRAHRFAYEALVGLIPEGLTLDHLCRVRSCVNPGHLDPVSIADNVRRGQAGGSWNRRKTRCPLGHPYDETNTKRVVGRRVCRACRAIYNAARRLNPNTSLFAT